MDVLQKEFEIEASMNASAEDKILSIVFRRLKEKTGVTLEDIYASTGIPPSSLCDLSGGSAQRYMSRIVTLSRYFREVHKMDHVSTDYLLTGTEDDRSELKRELEEIRKKNQELSNQLSFFQHLKEKETA